MIALSAMDGAMVAASVWAFLVVAWGILITVLWLLIGFRAMRAHERLAAATERIAQNGADHCNTKSRRQQPPNRSGT